MNKQKIIFIRHGQTFTNVLGIIGGQKVFDLANLTPQGKIQAHLAGKCLSNEFKHTQPQIENIIFWSSTAQRAIDTATIIKEQLDHIATKLNTSDLILERNMMDNEGKPSGKLIKPFETTKQMNIRINKFMDMLRLNINQTCNNTIIVVTHGGIIQLLLKNRNIINCGMFLCEQTLDNNLEFIKEII